MAVPNEHTFPHLATLVDCSIKTALRWLKTKHWIGKYIGMHPGMSLALATFTNHSPKLPYLSNCITLVKIFFWKHRVNFVHYVLLPTEQAETYLKIYYLTHILRRVVKKKTLADRGGTPSWLPYSADSLWLGFVSCVPWQIPVRNMKEHSREIC